MLPIESAFESYGGRSDLMSKSIEEIRSELCKMDVVGFTLVEMETFMANEAMAGGEAGAVWTVYLTQNRPEEWLENFIDDGR
ncbi:hypothetical protein [uncultured Mediterranean phage uvDeep-CGR0-AD1-C123]|nr:hypothetical protein [uncultured Mediterranean phage uvDeep-CGR0-AD1-C123]